MPWSYRPRAALSRGTYRIHIMLRSPVQGLSRLLGCEPLRTSIPSCPSCTSAPSTVPGAYQVLRKCAFPRAIRRLMLISRPKAGFGRLVDRLLPHSKFLATRSQNRWDVMGTTEGLGLSFPRAQTEGRDRWWAPCWTGSGKGTLRTHVDGGRGATKAWFSGTPGFYSSLLAAGP